MGTVSFSTECLLGLALKGLIIVLAPMIPEDRGTQDGKEPRKTGGKRKIFRREPGNERDAPVERRKK